MNSSTDRLTAPSKPISSPPPPTPTPNPQFSLHGQPYQSPPHPHPRPVFSTASRSQPLRLVSPSPTSHWKLISARPYSLLGRARVSFRWWAIFHRNLVLLYGAGGRQGAAAGRPGLRPMGQDEERINCSDYTLSSSHPLLPPLTHTGSVVSWAHKSIGVRRAEEPKESS